MAEEQQAKAALEATLAEVNKTSQDSQGQLQELQSSFDSLTQRSQEDRYWLTSLSFMRSNIVSTLTCINLFLCLISAIIEKQKSTIESLKAQVDSQLEEITFQFQGVLGLLGNLKAQVASQQWINWKIVCTIICIQTLVLL